MSHTRLLVEHHQRPRSSKRRSPAPAAIRWLARLCLEPTTIGFDDLTHLLAAFVALPTQPTDAWVALTTICARHGITRPAVPI